MLSSSYTYEIYILVFCTLIAHPWRTQSFDPQMCFPAPSKGGDDHKQMIHKIHWLKCRRPTFDRHRSYIFALGCIYFLRKKVHAACIRERLYPCLVQACPSLEK
jgi:hypothetical protein